MILVGSVLLGGCGNGNSAADGTRSVGRNSGAAERGSSKQLLNLYFWADYLAPATLADFESQTGIKVSVSYYENNETLETRLLMGHSDFDIVAPTGPFFERQIKAGVYQTLDKSRLPNLKNLSPELLAKVARYDPGNAHGVIYTWGTLGLGYNERKIKALMPGAPLDSWRLVFDPAVAARIAPCGIDVLDAPAEMMRAVLAYLGRDPNSQESADLAAAQATLMKIRPYIHNINSVAYVADLANGDICLAVGFNGEALRARERARENGKDAISYVVPKEGSVLWFDMLVIPNGAPNLESAYAFMNYMMAPRVIADISNALHYANANTAALSLVNSSARDDPGIYAPPALLEKLAPFLADSAQQTRAATRMWQAFKTGE